MADKGEAEDQSFRVFLETAPNGVEEWVDDLNRSRGYKAGCELHTPDLTFYCHSEACEGDRFFRFESGSTELVSGGSADTRLLEYRCSNCLSQSKFFTLAMSRPHRDAPTGRGRVMKLGEYPTQGPPIPTKVHKLVGSDRELFFRGRRAEVQGLGIGALAYYRRIVEDQWRRIITQILAVAEKVPMSSTRMEDLRKAAEETQFSKAVALAKDAIPEVLLIHGHHNPLTLLHSVTSEKLHVGDENRSLQQARAIRTILFTLAERIDIALKDEAEITQAVGELLGAPDSSDEDEGEPA